MREPVDVVGRAFSFGKVFLEPDKKFPKAFALYAVFLWRKVAAPNNASRMNTGYSLFAVASSLHALVRALETASLPTITQAHCQGNPGLRIRDTSP